MEVANVLSKSYDIVRNNPKIIWPYIIFLLALSGIGLGASYAVLSPFYTIAQSAQGASATPGLIYNVANQVYSAIAPVLIGILALAVLIGPILYGVYVSIADQGLQKTRVHLGRAFATARRNYVKILKASVLVIIAWIIVAILFLVFFISPSVYLGLHFGSIVWVLIGSFLLVLAVILLGIYFFTLYPALVLERLHAMDAIKRSYEIGRMHKWLIFRLMFVTLMIGTGVGVMITLITTAVQIPLVMLNPLWGIIIAQVVNIVLNAAFSTWVILIPVIFYKEYVGKRMRSKK